MAALRKRGKYFYAYWRENGKVMEKAVGDDPRQAKIELVKIEERIASKRSGALRDIRWPDFIEKYLDFCKANMAADTVVRNKVIFNNFNKTISIRMLSDLTPEILEEYKLARRNNNINPNTINREITTFKSSMKLAAEWKYVAPQIWGVRKMLIVKKRPVFYTEEEIQKLLRKADPFWKLVIYIGFYAGLRRGEILNLEWPDVDFQRHLLKITPKAHWHPKDREAREIPTHPILESYLVDWKKLSGGNARVVPWSPKPLYLSLYFTKLVKRASVNKGSLHSLRHSFASHLAMRGVDLKRIGEMMGHTSIVTTQIYAHLLPSSLSKALAVMPGIYADRPIEPGTAITLAASPAPASEVLPNVA